MDYAFKINAILRPGDRLLGDLITLKLSDYDDKYTIVFNIESEDKTELVEVLIVRPSSTTFMCLITDIKEDESCFIHTNSIDAIVPSLRSYEVSDVVIGDIYMFLNTNLPKLGVVSV